MKSSTNRPLAAKKQFTIFNRLAAICKCSSMKNSACGTVNKNRYYLFSIILLLTLGTGTAWGATETITLANLGWTNATVQTAITATSATIELNENSASTKPTYYTSDGLRLYGVKNATTGGTIAFTPKTGITITKIVFTHTSSNSGVLAIKSGTGSYSSKTWSGTLTAGNTVSLVSTNSNASSNPQVRITKIVITYTEAASCDKKVTIQKGTESNGTFTLETTGTHETCNGEVVTKLSNITPDANYVFSEITQTGINTGVTIDQENKTVTYAQNTSGTSTVNVVFVQKQEASITLFEAGATQSITGKYVGDSYQLPSTTTATCGDKTFVGWSTVEVDNSAAKPPTNFYEPGVSVTLAASNTFYAVFAEGGGAGTTSWEKTDISNITSIDEVVITMSKVGSDSKTYTYAMMNNNGTSNPPTAETVTVSGSAIISEVYDSYKWNISNSSGNLTIYPIGTTEKWLYCNNANEGVRVGTNANKTFTISGNYLKNTATSRYVGVYITNPDWRCYTTNTGTSNIANQTLAFYKKTTTASYENYTTTCATETTYTVTIDEDITNGTVTADPTEAAEGATVTLTATPATNYNFDSWTVKDASNADVVVSGNTFTMPASNVTVSASFIEKSKYTITWNVAEGAVDPTQIYEGNTLGTLPTADNCASGKVFFGWTKATSVNADGSDIEYAKATDIPAGDEEYNAVYATQTKGSGEEGSAEVVLSSGVYNSTNKDITWTIDNYASIHQAKGTSSTDVGASYVASPRWYVGHKITITPQSSVNITKIVINQGADTKYQEFSQATLTNANIAIDGTNVTLTPVDGTAAITLVPTKQLRPTAITIHKGSVVTTSNYSLDCETTNTPFLTVSETAFDFGTLAQDETETETFTITGGYLAEDVALTISGTNATFFSVSPATITKADEVNESVTVTYNPTEVGEHTATLTIKTGDITKEIALSGKVLAPGKWVLVKDVATLSAGDEIIIAATEADYAIGEAASNNYKGAAITKVGETANADASVTVLQVEETDDAEVPYAFKAGSNYLYAASSSANQLKAQSTNNANGQWAITITDGVASIVAAKSSNRNVMQYNPNSGSPIFACYASASQGALAIYRNSENVVKPVITGEAEFVGSTQVTITAQSGLTVY